MHQFLSLTRNSFAKGMVYSLLSGGLLIGAAQISPVFAQSKAKTATAPFSGFGSGSKEPIRVDAGKLEVFDKEQKAVYSGDVIAIQGQTTLRCSSLVIFYDQKATEGAKRGAPAANTPPAANDTNTAAGAGAIKKLDCNGPVSVVSNTQTVTANQANYDAKIERVVLLGNVIISDGNNVQRGDRATYDTKTGVAVVDGGRVQGIFVTGGENTPGGKKQNRP